MKISEFHKTKQKMECFWLCHEGRENAMSEDGNRPGWRTYAGDMEKAVVGLYAFCNKICIIGPRKMLSRVCI